MLSLVLLCAGVALAEERGNPSANLTENNSLNNTGKQINLNQTDAQFTPVNLIDLARQKEADLKSDMNITQVASGDNASINLVLAPPGSILKMHYHNSRDEIAYVIKGQAVFNASGQEYALVAGDLMYIPSLMQHGVIVTGNETLQLISTFAPAFDGKDRIYV
ncbi:MAG: cupin domain-containing protein [Methanothrix sp.]|nr:cupin domain-containing protein [Methanothrix sp.]